MTTAVVALAAVVAVLAALLWIVLWMQMTERRGWVEERRALVDRAIARHTGEVVALERAAERGDRSVGAAERPVAVGL